MTPGSGVDDLWARHSAEWRDPAQIATQWEEASAVDPRLLRYSVTGDWWRILADAKITLLVTREYEHLFMALSAEGGEPRITFMRMPHPSGLAVDLEREVVYVASTRNPNQVYELAPVTSALARRDVHTRAFDERPLVPVGSAYYPGSLYMHDLALIGGRLHANAVGHNAVVRLGGGGRWERVWWPRAIETLDGPDFSRNYLQLNSIAAAADVRSSFFSASTSTISSRRPGHLNFAVDRRGVIFSGRTREPIAIGLTRPHSARLHEGALWVDDSGYGEVGTIADGAFESVARLPGWTRGLCFAGNVGFVGTSKVIPRFVHYAPGLDADRSVCGVHAVDLQTGLVIGKIMWRGGNQIFAVESVPHRVTQGLPFSVGKRQTRSEKELFYLFCTDRTEQ